MTVRLFVAGVALALSGGCAASSGSTPEGAAGSGARALRGSDFDGDGRADLVVGAPAAQDKTGRVYVYAGGVQRSAPAVLSGGLVIDARFGAAVAALGDADRDGFDDLAVGSEREGRVYVFRGGAGGLSNQRRAVITAPAGAEEHFGRALAAVGDLDGDGFAELAVADAGSAPRVYVYAGSAQGFGAQPRVVLASPDGSASFGWALAGADVDADGRAELLVAQPFAGAELGGGSVFVFAARGGDWAELARPVAEITNPDPDAYDFGHALAGAGDVDADGYPDVLVGTFSDPGRAYLYRGTPGGLSPQPAAVLLPPASAGAHAGVSVAAAGDVDGDGYADVLVGATGVGPSSPGAVALYRGRPNGLSARPDALVQGPAGAGFGGSVAAAGDADGDGYPDVLVGAPFEKRSEGRVYVYRGAGLEPRAVLASPELLPAEFGRVASP